MDPLLVFEELAEGFEGCEQPVRRKAMLFTTYYDVGGTLTLGYGHTNLGGVPPRIIKGMVWTHDQCLSALGADLNKSLLRVKSVCSIALKPWELVALADFDFNTGDLTKGTVLKKIEAGDIDAAMATLLQYNRAAGKVYPGLTRRRRCEEALFRGDFKFAMQLAGEHLDTDDVMAKTDQEEGDGQPHRSPEDLPNPLNPPAARTSLGNLPDHLMARPSFGTGSPASASRPGSALAATPGSGASTPPASEPPPPNPASVHGGWPGVGGRRGESL
jgi:GH24 family phage-related lysozyme (muramidase)